MRNRSVKRAKQEREYLKLRKEFLEGKGCKVCSDIVESGMHAPSFSEQSAQTVHHMRGRIGDLLTDIRYWLPVCMDHHRLIEEHPNWAKQKGYSLSRLAKEEVSELKKV